jgi:hypothetical protein
VTASAQIFRCETAEARRVGRGMVNMSKPRAFFRGQYIPPRNSLCRYSSANSSARALLVGVEWPHARRDFLSTLAPFPSRFLFAVGCQNKQLLLC